MYTWGKGNAGQLGHSGGALPQEVAGLAGKGVYKFAFVRLPGQKVPWR